MIPQIIDTLKLNLNLDTGPAIQGSVATKLVEQRFYQSNWQPNDIDLICHKTILNKIDQHLEKLSYKTQLDIFKYYWIEGLDIPFSLIPYNGPLSLYCKTADYSCNAVLSDGENFLYHPKSLDDIKNKILRLINIKTIFNYSVLSYNHALIRYNKIVQRGYIDKDNLVLEKIYDYYKHLPVRKRHCDENS